MKNNWKGDFYDEIGFSCIIVIYIFFSTYVFKSIYLLIILIIFNDNKKRRFQLISIYNIGLREIISRC